MERLKVLKFFWILIALLVSPLSNAKEHILGHNLTPTTSVLEHGDFMIGSYAIGYGVNDNLIIATSLWLDVSYNMPNLGFKYAFPFDGDNSKLALEALYFKTYPFGGKLFEQESYYARVTYGLEYFEIWNAYFTYGYQYFFNDKRAYSLRAVPQNEDPYTISISSLQVLNLNKQLALLVEWGRLGLNYPVPSSHYGASINFRTMNWMIQLGLSASESKKNDIF